MTEPEIVEDFYGVYLLFNINPKYKGRTYIGYTRDPNRRIMQHNRGTWAGGAHRTSNRGPWKMVMIIHGFPNNISALRFEWAWQNPNKTTRLQHLNLKKIPRKETEFQFKLRVLSEMLRVGPWCRLPLVIRWLENDYREELPPERTPPGHMTICQGPVKSYNHRRVKKITTSISTTMCKLCSGYLQETERLNCINVNCALVSHVSCLANLFLPPGEYIPIHGYCPFCKTKLKWGDLIRKMNGYDQGIIKDDDEEGEDVENDDVVCTQDRVFIDNFEDVENDVCTQDRVFLDNFEDDEYDDVVRTQDRVSIDKFNDGEIDDVICTQDGVFVDKDDEYDVICTQDKVSADNFDGGANGDAVCTQDRVSKNNFVYCKNDDVVCKQDREFVENLENSDTDDVICTQNVDKYVVSDEDDDDEVIFKPKKVYDDHPSWFFDCNEDL